MKLQIAFMKVGARGEGGEERIFNLKIALTRQKMLLRDKEMARVLKHDGTRGKRNCCGSIEPRLIDNKKNTS